MDKFVCESSSNVVNIANLEIITGRAGPQADPAGRQADPMREVGSGLAGVWRVAGLAGELAQRAAVHHGRHAVADLRGRRRQEALLHLPREAHRAAALAVLAELRAWNKVGWSNGDVMIAGDALFQEKGKHPAKCLG